MKSVGNRKSSVETVSNPAVRIVAEMKKESSNFLEKGIPLIVLLYSNNKKVTVPKKIKKKVEANTTLVCREVLWILVFLRFQIFILKRSNSLFANSYQTINPIPPRKTNSAIGSKTAAFPEKDERLSGNRE